MVSNASKFMLVQGGLVLDADRNDAEEADILVQDDTIREIGKGLSAPAEAERINANRRIVIPGLVNSHTHSQGNLAKAHGDRWNLELLLNNGPWMSAQRNPEDKYLSAALGAAEMIRRGCTACYDLFAEIPHVTVEGLHAVAQAYADVGMRAVVAPMLADITFHQSIPGLIDAMQGEDARQAREMRAPNYEDLTSVCRSALKGWTFGAKGIALNIAPTIPLLCTDNFLRSCRELSDEFGVGIHTHMAESRVWSRLGELRYGCSLAEHFDKFGLISPRFTAAHGVWLSDTDLAMMAEKGASVAHNPLSNMRLGSGLADVPAMRRMGVNVGIGTDSCTCSDTLSMFESMRLASYTSRVLDYDVTQWLRTDEVFRMATLGSATALGWGTSVGKLAVGYKADLVLLDRDDVGLVPLHNVTNQLVHCVDSSAVRSVVVGGKIIYDNGDFLTIDYPGLVRRVESAADRLLADNSEQRNWASRLEPLVVSVCSGLARQKPHRNSEGLADAQ